MSDLFKVQKIEWLEKARQTAKDLLKTRDKITIEDVLEVCPLPKFLHRNTIGAVFTRQEFDSVGIVYSRRKSSHRRLIRQWSIRDVTRKRRPMFEEAL